MKTWAVGVAIGLATGCTKPSANDRAGASASSSTAAPAPVAASVLPAASGAPGSPAPAVPASSWGGAYAAKLGPVDTPKAAHEKTWTDDPGQVGVGPGTIELAVQSGAATGQAQGALGDLLITGSFDGHELRANLLPKDPNREGAMTGFMALAAEGDPATAKSMKGVLRVSGRDAKVVREASVELARK